MFVRNQHLPRQPRGAVRPLPDQRELVAAFGGHSSDSDDDHPLLAWAATLATLHRQRHTDPLAAAGIDCRRMELVATIDAWVVDQLPRKRSTDHLRAESLGATVDRMAAAHVHASHLLHTAEKVSDARVHAAWYRLALLADEWTDLITGGVRETVRSRRPA
ncbi:DUF4254 domain-containing protein [Nocardia amamiensis]|uniref:DUF4254 domain-containing protein n=1 Tax=Nocardia amamiensis TaxID=404578 RepID=A0ABS0CYG0_9NOCA|nr:DUF4254 domain-containing protein [Nocardia amamiensis]MBF6300903.1 DUF4254 domain-containing protein [Nocardia amamiensis]